MSTLVERLEAAANPCPTDSYHRSLFLEAAAALRATTGEGYAGMREAFAEQLRRGVKRHVPTLAVDADTTGESDGERAFRKAYEPDEYEDAFRGRATTGEWECVSALDVFRIAGGDVECSPRPSAAQALDCLRDLRACYDESLRDAAAPTPPAAGEGECRVPDGMKLGESIYTPASEEVRFCYSRGQPNNVNAWSIGEACRRAADASVGDYIDRGLALLKELEARGYGVFRFAAAPPPEPTTKARIQRGHLAGVAPERDAGAVAWVNPADLAAWRENPIDRKLRPQSERTPYFCQPLYSGTPTKITREVSHDAFFGIRGTDNRAVIFPPKPVNPMAHPAPAQVDVCPECGIYCGHSFGCSTQQSNEVRSQEKE